MTLAYIKRFLRDESGAVTVDWVVLTAGVMMLAVALAMPMFYEAIGNVSEGISAKVESASAYLDP